ncbi:NUDIX domain-containing protein [Companilactobacillus musae]|uniref:NUDIX domain-containing protein n=1 Tax=Companilactobacillus musae TaxID=1903258 RepID=UPI000E64ECDE|nr:NUDIX domain-containing protein [Companilactobacillus musae]
MWHKEIHVDFGVYGIIAASNKLLVTKNSTGPYKNRFDLPGGKLDDGKSSYDTMVKKVSKTTGLQVLEAKQLGTVSFSYPWQYQNYDWRKHVCTFYQIVDYLGVPITSEKQFVNLDTGVIWIDIEDLNLENSSPLVLKAKEFILLNEFVVTDTKYVHWSVLD